mmetsp:Transcript_17631/g.19828  ORF Transcript_17631/g.19828 Transcript_17631/m.19828 type:complete len:204 (-) Transcript_17631:53-664(-)
MISLKELHLNSNKIFKDYVDIDLACDIFKTFKNLEVLTFQENSLNHEQFARLLEIFCGYKNLKHLNISRNLLTEESINALINAMENGYLRNLEFLDISFNQIGIEGFKDLCTYYTENPEFTPKELLIRGAHFAFEAKMTNQDIPTTTLCQQLLDIQLLLSSICKPGFKKLVLKPNNLRKTMKEKFKSELYEVLPSAQSYSIIM